MVTVQNFEVMSRKFQVLEINTTGKCAGSCVVIISMRVSNGNVSRVSYLTYSFADGEWAVEVLELHEWTDRVISNFYTEIHAIMN
jgi:hypothetical protein